MLAVLVALVALEVSRNLRSVITPRSSPQLNNSRTVANCSPPGHPPRGRSALEWGAQNNVYSGTVSAFLLRRALAAGAFATRALYLNALGLQLRRAARYPHLQYTVLEAGAYLALLDIMG